MSKTWKIKTKPNDILMSFNMVSLFTMNISSNIFMLSPITFAKEFGYQFFRIQISYNLGTNFFECRIKTPQPDRD